jgi:hypothetical protein
MHPSLAAVMFLPHCNGADPTVVACAFDARWPPTKVWVEPKSDISVKGTSGLTKESTTWIST